MKLLLIGPAQWNDDCVVSREERPAIPRLCLLQLAGLTPKDVEIEIVEELVRNIDFETNCDLVGITAFTSQAPRAYEIAYEFRKRGKSVVMGGIHASLLPNEAMEHADSIIIGEADHLWGDVINDFKNEKLKPIYKCSEFHDLKGLPIPRYDLVDINDYFAGAYPVQATRGCPHDCGFCSVTPFFGGKYRLRPISEVIRDVKATGSKRIIFVDDNIVANREYAKELFTRLIPLKIKWFSQSTVNIGRFPELCKLAAKSGCYALCVGIESINQEAIKSVGKNGNKVEDYYKLLKSVRKNGLSVFLSMIIGLDGDEKNVFDNTFEFISKVKPALVFINVPLPYPGTKMTNSLEADNRILHKDWSKYRGIRVAFSPKSISRVQLVEKTLSLYERIYTYKSIIARCRYQPLRFKYQMFSVNREVRKNVYGF